MLKNKLFIADSTEPQTTLAKEVTIDGASPFGSQKAYLRIRPATQDFGLQFKVGKVYIAAHITTIKPDEKGHTTSLAHRGVEIKTVEHLLSALWGMGVDNALLELGDNGLIPMHDASAAFYAARIKEAGLKELPKMRQYVHFKAEHAFTESPDEPRYARFTPNDVENIDSTTSFDNLIGTHSISFINTPANYYEQVAWARTFLRSPIDDKGEVWQRIRKVFPWLPSDPQKSPLILFTDTDFLVPLKTADEPARHKALDYMGDMALLGIRLKAATELYLPGHRFTRAIVKEIYDALSEDKSQ